MLYKFIGAQIRARRRAKNLTQDQLSEAADISPSFLGHIERGTRKLSVETLCRIAGVLDCSIDELMGMDRNYTKELSVEDHLRQALLILENGNIDRKY